MEITYFLGLNGKNYIINILRSDEKYNLINGDILRLGNDYPFWINGKTIKPY